MVVITTTEGSLLLIFTICGLILHSWLFIETYLNGFTFNTLQPKNGIAVKNTL